jgi:D-alanyl-D-alanine carboxypeptidase (penicillin-binding protein 5/6)
LIPSANNIGDSLARWAFGSIDSYIAYANQMVKNLGLTKTTVANTNGFDDKTVSTADDLVRLGLAALNEPIVADIASQRSASIPVQGQIRNVNWLLGSNGVVGIKTGNTDKAGGCFLFAAKRQVGGRPLVLVGATLGAKDLSAAISAAPGLLDAGDAGFKPVTIAKKGQLLAEYKSPWGDTAQVKAGKDLSMLVWKDRPVLFQNHFDNLETPAAAGRPAGSIQVTNASQSVNLPVRLSNDLPGPTWHWRIFHR